MKRMRRPPKKLSIASRDSAFFKVSIPDLSWIYVENLRFHISQEKIQALTRCIELFTEGL
jgi:hypothetical protein